MQAPPPPVHPPKNNNVLWIVLGVLAVCGLGGVAIMAAILFPVFSQAKLAAKKTQALSHVKRIGTSMMIYAADYDDRLPIAEKWVDLTSDYTEDPSVYRSPEATPNDPNDYGFAFRKEFSKLNLAKAEAPAAQVMIFDSTLLQKNASSGLETLPSPGRYGVGDSRGNMMGFLDTHAKFVRDAARNDLGPDGKPAIR